jgi:hypothetical protein
MAKAGDACIREVCFEDQPGVESLMERVGLSQYPHRVWVHRWKNNPALQGGSPPLSQGWVLESGDTIVGYLGSIPHTCRFGRKRLVAAATTAFGVLPEFRNHSLAISLEFLRQKGVDLLLSTTATAPAARIFRFLQFQPIPQQGYDSALYLALNPGRVVAAYLARAGVPGALRQFASPIGGAVLSTCQSFRGRLSTNPKERGFEVVAPGMIGEGFDVFWEQKGGEREVFLPERSQEWLRWHFCPPEGKENISFVCVREDERLVGYAVVRKDEVAGLNLTRARILDLMAQEDRPDIIDRLLRGCNSIATEYRTDFLEMVGFPSFVRERFVRQGAGARRLPCWPYFYLAKNADLARDLGRESAWYGCPYDGDAGL